MLYSNWLKPSHVKVFILSLSRSSVPQRSIHVYDDFYNQFSVKFCYFSSPEAGNETATLDVRDGDLLSTRQWLR